MKNEVCFMTAWRGRFKTMWYLRTVHTFKADSPWIVVTKETSFLILCDTSVKMVTRNFTLPALGFYENTLNRIGTHFQLSISLRKFWIEFAPISNSQFLWQHSRSSSLQFPTFLLLKSPWVESATISNFQFLMRRVWARNSYSRKQISSRNSRQNFSFLYTITNVGSSCTAYSSSDRNFFMQMAGVRKFSHKCISFYVYGRLVGPTQFQSRTLLIQNYYHVNLLRVSSFNF